MNFQQKYKSLSHEALLKILENAGDYEPGAIEVAMHELESRKLNVTELENIKHSLAIEQKKKQEQEEKKRATEKKLKGIVAYITETFSPLQTKAATTDKIIRIVSFTFAAIILYRFICDYDMVLDYACGSWDFFTVQLLFPYAVLSSASVLFFLKKTAGWILFTLYFSFSLICHLFLFINALTLPDYEYLYQPFNFLPQISPYTHFTGFIFFCAMLYLLCKAEISAIYDVGQTWITVSIGIGLSAASIMTLYWL